MNNTDLEALARKWREALDVDPGSEYDSGVNESLFACADELEAALAAQAQG